MLGLEGCQRLFPSGGDTLTELFSTALCTMSLIDDKMFSETCSVIVDVSSLSLANWLLIGSRSIIGVDLCMEEVMQSDIWLAKLIVSKDFSDLATGCDFGLGNGQS